MRCTDPGCAHSAAALALAAIGAVACSAAAGVVSFDAEPERNSVAWQTFAEASGAVIAAPMEFSTHPEGPLDRGWFLCSHGAVLEGVCMNEVGFGSGALTGALTEPISTGEGAMNETSFVYNAWAGAWEITVSFRRPVVGVGVMTADHFNPFDVNAMTLEVFDDLHGGGATIGAASSPAFNFQLNHRFFVGIVDTEARIRSFRLSCPNLHSDTVFIEAIHVAVDPWIESQPLASADLNMDGVIGGADLGIVMAAWGTACVTADLDASGVVDGVDMGAVLAQWNELPAVGGGGDGDRPEDDPDRGSAPGTTASDVSAATIGIPPGRAVVEVESDASQMPGSAAAVMPRGVRRPSPSTTESEDLSRGVTGTRVR